MSCDPRDHGRQIRIVRVDERYAYYHRNYTPKPGRIRLNRMYPHSTGWRLEGR